jgi:hypothetical protein
MASRSTHSDSSFAPHSSAPLHLQLLGILYPMSLKSDCRLGTEVFWLSVLGRHNGVVDGRISGDSGGRVLRREFLPSRVLHERCILAVCLVSALRPSSSLLFAPDPPAPSLPPPPGLVVFLSCFFPVQARIEAIRFVYCPATKPRCPSSC